MNEKSNVEETSQFVIFKLGNEEYGVDIHKITTIERLNEITRVPKTSEFVKGVMSLRGEVVPVIDLRKRFQLPEVEYTDESRIVVFTIEDIVLGMIVDTVTEVVQIPKKNIENVSSLSSHHLENYIYGVGKIGERIITLLDLSSLIENSQG